MPIKICEALSQGIAFYPPHHLAVNCFFKHNLLRYATYHIFHPFKYTMQSFFQYIRKVEHPLPQSYFRQLLSPLIKKNPIPINNPFLLPTFPPIPSPMQLLIYFLFAHSEHFKYMKLYNMWYFVSGFFCLTCFQNLSCFSMYQFFIPFYCQRIFHCMDVSYFVYPLISWQILGLCPYF